MKKTTEPDLTPDIKAQIIEGAHMAHAPTNDPFSDDGEWKIFRDRVNAFAQREAQKQFQKGASK